MDKNLYNYQCQRTNMSIKRERRTFFFSEKQASPKNRIFFFLFPVVFSHLQTIHEELKISYIGAVGFVILVVVY